jgi:hypothetical protein
MAKVEDHVHSFRSAMYCRRLIFKGAMVAVLEIAARRIALLKECLV